MHAKGAHRYLTRKVINAVWLALINRHTIDTICIVIDKLQEKYYRKYNLSYLRKILSYKFTKVNWGRVNIILKFKHIYSGEDVKINIFVKR